MGILTENRIDIERLNEAILAGWRALSPADLEAVAALADENGGLFQKVAVVGDRVRVLWGAVILADIPLSSVQRPPERPPADLGFA